MSVDDRYDPSGTSTTPIPGLGNANTNTSTGTTSAKPNKRQHNPLSEYSSYTYNLSLYVTTWDAYKDFVETNRTYIDLADPKMSGKGAYLIAQSGGINDSVTPRAPGFLYDYYIDDLKISHGLSPQETGTSSATTDITFTITEPYGFSFISNLKRATDAVKQYDTTKNADQQRNASKQFFILGIKFLGYDGNGDPINETEGMFQRYWDISINSIKYKIDGKVTTYHITAAPVSIQCALGTKRGMVNRDMTVRGKTVADLLTGTSGDAFGIITKMNEDERMNHTSPFDRNVYNIEFYGPGAEDIANASFVSAADTEKSKTPLAQAKGIEDINARLELKSAPNLTSRELTIKSATPVVQVVQQIISQSTYLTDALKTLITTSPEPNDAKNSPELKDNSGSKKALRWYNLSTKLANPRFSTDRNDYVFDITYVIQTYETPVVVTANANEPTPYYGPIKRYEYWFSGKNSEILKYEQKLDNTFYNVALIPDGTPESTGGGAIPLALDKRQNQARLNKNDQGAEIQNQYVNYMLDPGNFAAATIEILGDPDWLIQPSPGSLLAYNKFYGPDGYSVNPSTGQVFIEISFKEARDYDTDVGLMHVNDNIVFWNYPDAIMSELNGAISYRVNRVTNMFRGGKFTQELRCVVNTFGTNIDQTVKGATARETPVAGSAPAAPSSPTAPQTGSTGTTINQQAAARIRRQGGTPASGINAIAAARIKRQGSGVAANPAGNATDSTGLIQNPPISSLSNGTVAPTQVLDPAQAQQTIADTPNGPLYIDP